MGLHKEALSGVFNFLQVCLKQDLLVQRKGMPYPLYKGLLITRSPRSTLKENLSASQAMQ
jgi:hypothetical protein